MPVMAFTDYRLFAQYRRTPLCSCPDAEPTQPERSTFAGGGVTFGPFGRRRVGSGGRAALLRPAAPRRSGSRNWRPIGSNG